jgi:uncharacterized protein (DUF433 family)
MAGRKPTANKRDHVKQIGRYIVADPKICHGKLTFRGTRILVADVLEQVAAGMPWEHIIEQWRGSIPRQAIAEAAQLAREVFLEHADEFVPPAYNQRKAS